jgi:hypothetical protein
MVGQHHLEQIQPTGGYNSVQSRAKTYPWNSFDTTKLLCTSMFAPEAKVRLKRRKLDHSDPRDQRHSTWEVDTTGMAEDSDGANWEDETEDSSSSEDGAEESLGSEDPVEHCSFEPAEEIQELDELANTDFRVGVILIC